ncbi:gas vesicle protein GvpG [Nonomuraea pusilla]|uniref:gas vesicle protein GvpG n=1 Tax=Nonomuraea pusilla TaxID=46177 RepID=UPI00332A99E6
MGLISSLFTWPLLPVRGVIRLGELIQEQVDQELHDPTAVRRELEEIERAMQEGRISEEEAAEAMEQVVTRMTGSQG